MRRTSPWSAPTVLQTSNRQGYFEALFVTTHPPPNQSNHTIPHPRRWDAWARQFSKVDDPCFLPLQDGFAEHQYSNLKKIVGPGGPTPWIACQSEDTRQQKRTWLIHPDLSYSYLDLDISWYIISLPIQDPILPHLSTLAHPGPPWGPSCQHHHHPHGQYQQCHHDARDVQHPVAPFSHRCWQASNANGQQDPKVELDASLDLCTDALGKAERGGKTVIALKLIPNPATSAVKNDLRCHPNNLKVLLCIILWHTQSCWIVWYEHY